MPDSKNQHTLDHDTVFLKACELAGTPPTLRQASKWNNGYGKAHQFRTGAHITLQQEAEASMER